MSDKPRLLARVNAKVRALLPEHWHGETGKLFRTTIDSISEYSRRTCGLPSDWKKPQSWAGTPSK